MKVWITKYALTSGTFEAEAEIASSSKDGQMIRIGGKNSYGNYYHGEGKEWHRTKDSALDRLGALKEKKIASLKKQIKKIESITIK